MAGHRAPGAEPGRLLPRGSQALGPRHRPRPQAQQQGPEQRAGGGDHGAGRCGAGRAASDRGRAPPFSPSLLPSALTDPPGR